MNYDTLRGLLDTQLQTVSALPMLQTENTRITVSPKAPWTRATLLPAEPADLGIGPSAWIGYRGLYQVCLFYPKATGTTTANAIAQAVQQALPRGFMASSGDVQVIVEMSWQETAYTVDDWYCVPVSVRWVSYSQTV
jgi:hypothetical protein